MIKPRETFHFNPPVGSREDWLIVLTDLGVYNSIFKITEENNKLQFYKLPMKKLVVYHMKMSETRLKKTWIFRILQLMIYKMIYLVRLLLKSIKNK